MKNNLQIISSLLHLQYQNTTNSESRSQLQAAENRIDAMSIVHELMYNQSDYSQVYMQEYIQVLADRLSSEFGKNKDIKPHLQIEKGTPE
ncbi:MAG: histidine kinase dimerization/phosphoacceptor domain -containing protein [Spirochaetia bacterium]